MTPPLGRVGPAGRQAITALESSFSIHVVDVSTGESTEVADGRMAAWLDDDMLIVAPEKP